MIQSLPPELVEAIYTAAEGGETNLRTDYSGRNMYGETCVGIVGSMRGIMRTLIYLAEAEPMLAVHMAECLRTDNMGRDMIAYFPGVTVAGPTP